MTSERTLDGAVARLIELRQGDFGFSRQHDGTWQAGTLIYGGDFNYCGYGPTPAEAAWALVADLERAAAQPWPGR